ncbi:DUF397 domain-containing protein [Streptomyces sp. NPDC004609]|uniref:DUF397 domain-containing protein n=1 Tax=Streptomyces sp. NPDC004609 TaxID=3364704 RepID=UPI0036AEAAFA
MTEPRAWHKSSFSAGENLECVEVARNGDGVMVRDSKRPQSSVLCFSLVKWSAFVDHARQGSSARTGRDEAGRSLSGAGRPFHR